MVSSPNNVNPKLTKDQTLMEAKEEVLVASEHGDYVKCS